jgi:hypothetical protein
MQHFDSVIIERVVEEALTDAKPKSQKLRNCRKRLESRAT